MHTRPARFKAKVVAIAQAVCLSYDLSAKALIGDPPGLNGFGSIGAMRENGLQRAANTLGSKAVHLLGYRDSAMPGSPGNYHQALAAAPLEQVARQVAKYIREIRQAVITVDTIGG